jgi:uncharacterized protein YjiK
MFWSILTLSRTHLRRVQPATSLHAVVTAVLALQSAACSSEPPGDSQEKSADGLVQWALPKKLKEISGLALTDDERLLAVTDESGIVYELDYRTGRIVKAFALGNPTVRGDFEGIAVLDGTVWLMTSSGDLYAANEGDDGERVAYERYKTNLGNKCELEGLAEVKSRHSLALICKQAKKKLRVFEWAVAGSAIRQTDQFSLPEKAMEKAIGKKRVNPSGITIEPDTGSWLILASRQNAVFELSHDGELIDVIMRLNDKRHRQAEGIAITSDGHLLIADEGGNGPARLAVYKSKTGNKKN